MNNYYEICRKVGYKLKIGVIELMFKITLLKIILLWKF